MRLRASTSRRISGARLCTIALSCLLALTACAQDPPRYVLHVYERLVQLPTLVLSPDLEPLPPIDPHRFSLRLDDGPRFHPNRIRLEGDDPISLSILLDLSGSQSDVTTALRRDFAPWLAASFKPQDRISIYAIDCHLVRSADNVPPDPTARLADLGSALDSTLVHGPGKRSSCANSVHLWDAMAVVMEHAMNQPGRRVLLLFSAGHDGASNLRDSDLRRAAARSGTTVFAYAEPSAFLNGDESLQSYCQRTGGLDRVVDPYNLARTLTSFIDTLRGRYILEFPTPVNSTEGQHDIEVEISRSDAFIRPSSVTIAIPDPSIAADPTTLPNTTTDAPQLGNHRPPQH